MVRLTRITTRGGDRGETSLGTGERVSKHAPRIEAIGDVDEANAAIGVARLHTDGQADAMLGRIQNDLFDLGADLASPSKEGDDTAPVLRITAAQVGRLEREIEDLNARLSALDSFVLPGGSPAAAHLHAARTVVRRAERRITRLAETEPVNPEAVRYVNRLSDLLFVAARHLNADGAADVKWEPGATRE